MNNIATVVTFSRFIFAISVAILLCFDSKTILLIAVILFILGALSDAIDGTLARKQRNPSRFGAFIDPIADKVCFLVVLIYLIDSFDNPTYMYNPFIVIYVMLAIRDTILISLSLYNILFNKYVAQANVSGKFFIFISSLMVVFYIYDFNATWGYIFYILTILMLIINIRNPQSQRLGIQ